MAIKTEGRNFVIIRFDNLGGTGKDGPYTYKQLQDHLRFKRKYDPDYFKNFKIVIFKKSKVIQK